jgi:hypothetical protein
MKNASRTPVKKAVRKSTPGKTRPAKAKSKPAGNVTVKRQAKTVKTKKKIAPPPVKAKHVIPAAEQAQPHEAGSLTIPPQAFEKYIKQEIPYYAAQWKRYNTRRSGGWNWAAFFSAFFGCFTGVCRCMRCCFWASRLYSASCICISACS